MNVKKLIEYPKSGILSKELIKSKDGNIELFCMAAGAEISKHTSTKRVVVYILEGKGVFNAGKKRI